MDAQFATQLATITANLGRLADAFERLAADHDALEGRVAAHSREFIRAKAHSEGAATSAAHSVLAFSSPSPLEQRRRAAMVGGLTGGSITLGVLIDRLLAWLF